MLPTGSGIADWIRVIGGNILTAILVFRGLYHWGKAEWGALIGFFVGAAIVASFVWYPEQSIGFLKALGSLFFRS